MILVDTSVWIGWLNGRDRQCVALGDVVAQDGALLIAPVLSELLVGARGDRERDRVLALSGAVRHARLDTDLWIAAGDLGRHWRERGRTLGAVDLALAAVARRDDLALWTLDRDFEPLFEGGAVRRYLPPPG